MAKKTKIFAAASECTIRPSAEFVPFPSLETVRAQFLIAAYSVQPDRAVMLAGLAFGEVAPC